MSAHMSQVFSIEHSTDSEDLPEGMTNNRIELHWTMSDHVCKQEIVISKAKSKSAGIRG